MKSARNWNASRPRANRIRPGLPAIVVCGLLFSLLGAGCEIPLSWEGAWSPEPASTTTSTWQVVAPGVDRLDQRLGAETAAARFIIWRITPEANLTWSIAASTTHPQLVSAWSDADPEAVFTLNGGYFHADGQPSGWARAGGQILSRRTFDAQRSGLVVLGDEPSLFAGTVATGTFQDDGFQSYPWLVEDGRLAFTQETGQYARRTFVGTDMQGNWYVGIVPSESVTLHQLGKLLLQVPVRWNRVINLDGGPSTGLVTQFSGAEDRFDSFSPVPYVIVARPRS